MVALYKRPDSPFWYYDLVDPKTRKRRRHSTGETTKKAAEVKRLAAENALAERAKKRDREITLRQAYEGMLEGIVGTVKTATIDDYKVKRDKTLGFGGFASAPGHAHLDPEMCVHDLETSDLHRLRAARYAAGATHRTVGYELSVLRRAVRYAIAHMRSRRPEIEDWEVPEGDRKTRYLSPAEFKRLLEWLDPDRPIVYGRTGTEYAAQGRLREQRQDAYDLCLSLVYCGGRWSEVASLTWRQVDFEREVIELYGSKTDEPRHVPLAGRVKEIMERRRKRARGDYVFPGGDGEERSSVARGIARGLQAIGANSPAVVKQFGRATTHSLRHTFASWMRQGGAALDEVQLLLGHKSLAMTKRYAHITPTEVIRKSRELLDKIDERA